MMTTRRLGQHCVVLTTLAAALLVGTPATVSAQRVHFGPRFGINFDNNDVLVGAQLTVPMTGQLEFYPSLEIYFPDAGSLLGFSADLKFRFPPSGGPQFYVGGGLNILHSSFRGNSHSDTGGDLLFGLESRTGTIHPFGEGRLLLHDRSTFELVGGLNITLGP